jgi:murein L,D-transpeptidase YcbB/YkuD
VTQQKFLIKLQASVKWFARICRTRAETGSRIVRHWLRQTRVLLRKRPGEVLKAKPWGLSRSLCLGGTLLLLASLAAVGFTFPLDKRVAPTLPDAVYRNSTHPSTAQPSTPSPQITRIDSIRVAIHKRVAMSGSERRKREQRALFQYYSVPTSPLLWVDDNGLTDRAESVIEEIGRADEFGLHAADYELPTPGDFSFDENTSIDWLAEAEVKISLVVLQYAQDARGSRIKPARLTRNLDPTLALPDPLEVLVSDG